MQYILKSIALLVTISFSNILKSFVHNRFQYVSIDTINSKIIEAPPCSVIQGSKLSSLLYTIYINEVTILQNLINDEIFTKITGLENVINEGCVKHNII